MKYPNSLIQLIRELSRLPGVGPKSAQRLAFHLFSSSEQDVKNLSDAILEAKKILKLCPVCYNITDTDLCAVCSDPSRDQNIICVVEEPGDVIAIERSGEFEGLYHVLHGALSPMNGVGPEQIKIAGLLERIQNHKIRGGLKSFRIEIDIERIDKANRLNLCTHIEILGQNHRYLIELRRRPDLRVVIREPLVTNTPNRLEHNHG